MNDGPDPGNLRHGIPQTHTLPEHEKTNNQRRRTIHPTDAIHYHPLPLPHGFIHRSAHLWQGNLQVRLCIKVFIRSIRQRSERSERVSAT